MAEARRPWFFRDLGAEDTPEGRLGVLIVVLFPVLTRLQAGDARARRVATRLTETFVTDIDDSLREMGVGDLTVPKKVKRAAQALIERFRAYTSAAAGSDPEAALAEEFANSVPGLKGAERSARELARYTLDASAALEAATVESVLTGKIPFPPATADFKETH